MDLADRIFVSMCLISKNFFLDGQFYTLTSFIEKNYTNA
jgi:hypothetical protein